MESDRPLDWKSVPAAVWRGRRGHLRPVLHTDPIRLDQLLGVDRQKQRLLENTERFLNGQPANNALLWGARGTGKSSLIKALLNDYRDDGLRVIQVDKEELLHLPDIVDDIRDLPQRFLIFCDDLSFEEGEHGYKGLKTVLEGSIEPPPDNVRIYATSNRRHLLPEYMEENRQSQMIEGELHLADAIEEKIALSDRFGLWLSFYAISQEQYFAIIDSLFPDYRGDRDELHLLAKRFAHERGIRSGRTARQFFNAFSAKR